MKKIRMQAGLTGDALKSAEQEAQILADSEGEEVQLVAVSGAVETEHKRATPKKKTKAP